MRVAICHDYLNQFGGAERVLQTLLELFPEADLYTLLYDEERTRGAFAGRTVHTSPLDVPFIRHHHRAFIPLMPWAASRVRGGFYDLVISSTAGYAKGFAVEGAFHLCYTHSPLRYAWERTYLKGTPFTPWPLRRAIADPVAAWLRAWDRRAADRVDEFIANSNFIAGKIERYYGRSAEVIPPPVDTAVFHPEPVPGARTTYLMAGRLLYYKRFDIGIEAFNRLKRRLVIVGQGPEEAKLRKLVRTPLIEFAGNPTDAELRLLYSNAKALIFPQVEDFGLVAAEALACGTPVIAYRDGGASDIVSDGETGVFFDAQTPHALVQAVEAFERCSWDREAIARRGARFSKERFKSDILAFLKRVGIELSAPHASR